MRGFLGCVSLFRGGLVSIGWWLRFFGILFALALETNRHTVTVKLGLILANVHFSISGNRIMHYCSPILPSRLYTEITSILEPRRIRKCQTLSLLPVEMSA